MDNSFLDALNTHRKLIYKVCHLYCSDTEDRKDLFQEIILQVWKSWGSFRNEAQLSTWMYRIALNTAITHFKKEKRGAPSLSIDGLDVPEWEEDDAKNEQKHLLFRAIDQLDKINKSIILLHLEEKNYEEIGEITGLTKSNVGVRLNRIKTKLSNILTK